MSYLLHLDGGAVARCRFALSPLWETVKAVRTTLRPRHQQLRSTWLDPISAAVRRVDLMPLVLLMPQPGWTPDFLVPPPLEPHVRIETELEQLRATPETEAHNQISRSLADTPGAAASPEGRRLLDEPGRAVRHLADLLTQAWQIAIAPRWPQVRALLDADIAVRARDLAEGGHARLFANLHPKVAWTPGTLTVSTRAAGTRTLRDEELILTPSVFVWPHLVSGFDPPWPARLAYPARGVGTLWAAPPRPAADHAALSRLLGRNRAVLLIDLAQPASTSTLADRHGLAVSTVSAHLSVLHDAGLVSSHRYRHEVLYQRTPMGGALCADTGPSAGR